MIDEDKTQEMGIGALIMKPVEMKEFSEYVRQVLSGQK